MAARDGFERALEQEPDNAEAAYGYARVLQEMNQYEEAVQAFERAMELAPDDPRIHEGYLNTLVWGGSLRGRRDWLDRTIEVGRVTIRDFPDRVEPYESVERAVGDLNQSERWLEILDSMAIDIASVSPTDESPVFRIHHIQAQLVAARSSGDEEAAVIEAELLRELESTRVVASDTSADPRHLYFMAVGYDLTDDSESQRRWLIRLDETPEGRRMGAHMFHFDMHYMDFFETRDAPMEERLEVTERWKQRFLPSWESGNVGSYAFALSEERSVLVREAGRQRSEDGQASAELLDRITDASRDLVLLDTWGGAWRYSQLVRTLIYHDYRLEEALAYVGEAIGMLEQGRPGLLYPGVQAHEMESTTRYWNAIFEHHRGRALIGLERDAEAEQSLLRAIATPAVPRSDHLATLGKLLARQGRDEEAYETLVSALAHNTEDERLDSDADSIREAVVAVAFRLSGNEASLDSDLEAARVKVADAARKHLVNDRLNLEAPDFSLTDTEGAVWRLSELQGKVVVLNYWATWCGPCRSEFPHYRDLVNSYAVAQDVMFLAITTDVDHSETRQFLSENDYTFTVLYDEGSATDFGVTGIPAHFILGPEGRIQYATSGFPGAERYNREMRLRIEALRPNGDAQMISPRPPSSI